MVLTLLRRMVYISAGAIIAVVAFGLYLHTNKQHVARIIQQSIVSSDDHCLEPTSLPQEQTESVKTDAQEIFFAGCSGFF